MLCLLRRTLVESKYMLAEGYTDVGNSDNDFVTTSIMLDESVHSILHRLRYILQVNQKELHIDTTQTFKARHRQLENIRA